MAVSDDYCDLCDLPRSQCIHGQPPPPPVVAPPPKPRVRSVAPARTPGAPAKAAAAKPVNRRWTPPETLKPLILDVLTDAGGELEAEDVFTELETLLGERLRPGDLESTPEGELRWKYAARRARQALIAEGLMTKGDPGVWKLAGSRA